MADPKEIRHTTDTNQPSASESPERVGVQPLSPLEKSDPAYSLNIANLTLRSTLGQGAHGTVYVAEHHILKKLVAVKVLHLQDGDDSNWSARFQREAQAMSRLNHPNIAKIFSYAVADDKQAVLVMELIEGTSLDDFIKANGVQSPELARRIFLTLLDAMGYAHDLGIIHRDLKPANIMIFNGELKILDFGVAKVGTNGGANQKLTATGQIIGTPAFMSPEQCRGQEADARSDIYSLACVLYFMLTGKTLFSGNDGEILIAHASHSPIFSCDLSPDLQKILEKALAKDPGQRFQSCRDFEKALESADLVTAPPNKKMSARKWFLPVVCLITLVGFCLLLLQRQPWQAVRTEFANAVPRGTFDHEFRTEEERIKNEFQENKVSSRSIKQLEDWTSQREGLSFENRIVALSFLLKLADSKHQTPVALKYADKITAELNEHEQRMHDKAFAPSASLIQVVGALSDLYRSNDQFEKAADQLELLKSLIARCARAKSEDSHHLLLHYQWYYQSSIRLAAAMKESKKKIALEREACKYFLENKHNEFYFYFAVQLIKDLISTNQMSEARQAFDNLVSQSLLLKGEEKERVLTGLHSIASELMIAKKPDEAIRWIQYARRELETKGALSIDERNNIALTFIDIRALMGVDDNINISHSDLRQLQPYVLRLIKDALAVSGEKKQARKLEEALLAARELTFTLALRKEKDTYSFLKEYFKLLSDANELTAVVISQQVYVLRAAKYPFTSGEVMRLRELFMQSLKGSSRHDNQVAAEIEMPYVLVGTFNWFLQAQDPTYPRSPRESDFYEECWRIIRARKDVDATEKLSLLYQTLEISIRDARDRKTLDLYASDFLAICRQDGSCNSRDSSLDFSRKEALQHFVTVMKFLQALKLAVGTEALFQYSNSLTKIVWAEDYYKKDKVRLWVLHQFFLSLSKNPGLATLAELNKYSDDLISLSHKDKERTRGVLGQAVAYCCFCLHHHKQDEKGFEFVSEFYNDHKTWTDDNPGIDAFLLSAKIACFKPQFGELAAIQSEYLEVLHSASPTNLGSLSHHQACIASIANAVAKFDSKKAALEFLKDVELILRAQNLAPEILIPYCKSQVLNLEKKQYSK